MAKFLVIALKKKMMTGAGTSMQDGFIRKEIHDTQGIHYPFVKVFEILNV